MIRQAALPPVAVIADAHYHDVEGDYGFEGADIDGRRLTVRSWADTRASTRVFNESFGALQAALDETVRRGIRHVVLLGDYSDDGQRATVASVARLLRRYRDRHGIRFFALPGNHDGYALHGRHQSKRFLRCDGQPVLVTSDAEAARTPGAVLSDAMYCEGYPEALRPMLEHGFTRHPADLHWETPFGLSDDPAERVYEIASPDGRTRVSMADASYLVEPADGLWLLMIDANVFEPRDGTEDLSREDSFVDSTNAGWNGVLRSKPFLTRWIADVHERARRLGKTLLCFSHYPVVDPFGDNLAAERALFGDTNVARRTPEPAVARRLIEAGMRRHFSGHMHVAGETTREFAGHRLVNVAVPSPVAFPPAFAVLRPGSGAMETVGLSGLPLDGRLVELYRREAARAGEAPHPAFVAPDYGGFLYEHARALVTHRYLPREWPDEIADLFAAASLDGILRAAGVDATRLAAPLAEAGVPVRELATCSGVDLATDWYCLRHAQELALPYIPPHRLALYRALSGTAPGEGARTPLAGFWRVFLDVMRGSIERAERAQELVPTPVARAV
ncbi:metallophosphoesterase [Aureimonas sp. ME7]|uniref:metallophosphoesterase family protein n=1 Tax=Aureimonas sp. ME7 TaxID=2744252 RepID=UPI001FCEAD17|nr:metallophosphoesterase [Aureimonas sp. ME7]